MKKMKKITFITSGILFVLGIIIALITLISIGFDFSKLSRMKGNALVNEQFSISNDTSILLNTTVSDIYVGLSDDEGLHVSYYRNDHFKHETEQSDNAFMLKESVISWGRPFNDVYQVDFHPQSIDIIILVPLQWSGKLSINTTDGDIHVGNIDAKSIDMITTTGDIRAKEMSSKGDILFNSLTGNLDLKDVYSDGNIIQESKTGDVNLKRINVVNLSLKGTTGNIKFDRLHAQNIVIDVTTGNVNGSVLGNKDEFSFSSRTTWGERTFPSEWGEGSKRLSVETTTGDINISFIE